MLRALKNHRNWNDCQLDLKVGLAFILYVTVIYSQPTEKEEVYRENTNRVYLIDHRHILFSIGRFRKNWIRGQHLRIGQSLYLFGMLICNRFSVVKNPIQPQLRRKSLVLSEKLTGIGTRKWTSRKGKVFLCREWSNEERGKTGRIALFFRKTYFPSH